MQFLSGPITFIFGRMIGHRRVVDYIISYHFDSMIFVGAIGLKRHHAYSI